MPRGVVRLENAENTELLFEKRPLQAAVKPVEDFEADFTVIKSGGFILLDFGTELCGGIEMSVRTVADPDSDASDYCAGARCRVVFGESVTEAMSNLGEKNSGNYHTVRDTTVDVVPLSTFRVGDTGFRFVRLEALERDIYIITLRAVSDAEPIEYKGMFECSDELLNRIWRTGAYTVELCTHEYIWDGVKRDRLVWIGDMHPEVSTVRTVFGDLPAIKRSLDFVRNSTPSGTWMNKTATYSMWWIIIHYDYFMHWGDFEYLSKQEEYLMPLCDNIIAWADTGFEGPSNEMKGFVDWSSKYTESEMEGRWAIGALSLDCARRIFGYLKNDAYAKRCGECLEAIRAAVPEHKTSKSISALTVLGGRDARFAKEVLGGSSPEDMSCFMGYYVLKAKALLGEYDESLELIKNYWGAMLSRGATTFWEDFDVEWLENSGRIDEETPKGKKHIHGDFGKHCYEQLRLSLCHGWASGPTPYLMEEIGGLEILEPGCKSIRVSPKLSGLDWLRVAYPTPYGKVSVFAQKTENGTEVKVDAPEAISVTIN